MTETFIFLANSFICDTNTFEYLCGKNTIWPITAYLIENGVGQNFEYKIVETILLPKTAYVLVYLNNMYVISFLIINIQIFQINSLILHNLYII